ncbi:hypothetical protein [Pararhizobium sp. PWRC1-1]|uniref:hypothetical protein n=1 Tax=Pararhizobium sp. PWRC1-1 TaxID=2804566 RepID=UPI003CF0498E
MQGGTRGLTTNGVTLEISCATDVNAAGAKEAQDRLTDGVKSEEAGSCERVEAVTDNTPNSGDRLVEGEPQPADQPDAGMAVPEHSAEAASNAQGKSIWKAPGSSMPLILSFSMTPLSPLLQLMTR